MSAIVTMDKESGDIRINIPGGEQVLAYDLKCMLSNAFAYEPITIATIKEMNEMAGEWLREKGVEVPMEES